MVAQPFARNERYGCGIPPAQPFATKERYGCGVPLAGIAGACPTTVDCTFFIGRASARGIAGTIE